MKAEKIPGANLVLTPPENHDTARDGEVYSLPVARMDNGFVSQWRPSPEELAALNAGAAVHLYILGNSHPPVSVEVGPLPASVPLN